MESSRINLFGWMNSKGRSSRTTWWDSWRRRCAYLQWVWCSTRISNRRIPSGFSRICRWRRSQTATCASESARSMRSCSDTTRRRSRICSISGARSSFSPLRIWMISSWLTFAVLLIWWRRSAKRFSRTSSKCNSWMDLPAWWSCTARSAWPKRRRCSPFRRMISWIWLRRTRSGSPPSWSSPPSSRPFSRASSPPPCSSDSKSLVRTSLFPKCTPPRTTPINTTSSIRKWSTWAQRSIPFFECVAEKE